MAPLTIDSKKLDAALKDNPKEVEALFLGKGKGGIKDRMEGIFNTYLGDKDSIDKKGANETTLQSLRDQKSALVKTLITAVQGRIDEAMLRSEKVSTPR